MMVPVELVGVYSSNDVAIFQKEVFSENHKIGMILPFTWLSWFRISNIRVYKCSLINIGSYEQPLCSTREQPNNCAMLNQKVSHPVHSFIQPLGHSQLDQKRTQLTLHNHKQRPNQFHH